MYSEVASLCTLSNQKGLILRLKGCDSLEVT